MASVVVPVITTTHAAAVIQDLGPAAAEITLQNITNLVWRIMKLVEIIKPPLTGAEKKQLTLDILLQINERFVHDNAMQALLRTYITQTLPQQIDILVAIANTEETLMGSDGKHCGCVIQ